jgi:hypothetical protein
MWSPPKPIVSKLEVTDDVGIAVREACLLLGLPRTGGDAESVARKVLELAQIGERDPKRLCLGAVKCFQA